MKSRKKKDKSAKVKVIQKETFSTIGKEKVAPLSKGKKKRYNKNAVFLRSFNNKINMILEQ